MPKTYTQAMREAIASVDSTIQFVDTISFSHASFPQTYRYSASDTDLVIGADTYTAKQFDLSLPEVGELGNTGINITVSNVTSQILRLFKTAIQSKTPILVSIKTFVPNQPTKTAYFSTSLFVKNVSFSNSDMVLSAGYPDSSNLKLPKEKYTTWECPGLRN